MAANHGSIGGVSEAAMVVDDATRCDEVERRFLEDPALAGVVVDGGGKLSMLSRSRFLTYYAGRLGHGRALYSGRSVRDLGAHAPALVLPDDTDVLTAGRIALKRPLAHRYDDLVVPGRDGLRRVHFATLLSAIAALHAQRAVSDPLTGLANRRLVIEELQRRIDADEADVCLLFVDVDDFKAVNDSLGHPTGDALLIQVADRLRDAFRDDDLVARLGGDEFVVLLRVGDELEARRAADRVALALAMPLALAGGRELAMRCSVGVVVRDAEADAEDLLRAADIAMYAAKRGGKGRSAVFRPAMHESARARLDLRSALPEAAASGQLGVVYQPVVELAGGAIVAVEALARWTHPERGPVPPSTFVPMAEELGIIGEIGLHVLAAATADVASLRRSHPALRVAVNVSALQLELPGFAASVLDTLSAVELRPADLTLELTETALIHDSAHALGVLHELGTAGVSIAIDDFGTGLSSLARLDRLPIDVLKFDKALVDPLAERPDRGLVKGLLDLAGALGVAVVAEGVEVAVQHGRLRDLGCRFAQGYLYARPVPAPLLTGLLHEAGELGPTPVPHARSIRAGSTGGDGTRRRRR